MKQTRRAVTACVLFAGVMSSGVARAEVGRADTLEAAPPQPEPAPSVSQVHTAPEGGAERPLDSPVSLPGPPTTSSDAAGTPSTAAVVESSGAGTASAIAATTNRAQEVDVEYRKRFDQARQALIENRDDEALAAFEELAKDAASAEDRRVAEEFANLARERVAARENELPPPHIRTTDELSVLYTTAFTYGFGTSAWLALQVKPSNFAAAVLPFVAITGAAVGGVALVDSYSPFRLGVPQSISAGTILGTLEGVWLSGYQHAVASRRDEKSWRSPTVATVLWAGATLGGVAGGLLGAVREPTPGQVSYTTSGGLWGGIAGALIAGAAESRASYRGERAYAVGALGYNVALIAALATSPQMAPSVARVRLVDLGGLAGGLLGAGGYLLVADEGANSRAAMGSAAGGALLGLGLSWWATSGMPEEPHPHAEQTLLSRLRPTVIPVRQGAVGVLELTL